MSSSDRALDGHTSPARTRLRFIRPFTTHLFNPVSRLFVKWLPGFAIIRYRGRRSGRLYRTPMNVFRRGDQYVFALTYGSDVQWVKNVLAAGVAELEVCGRVVHLRDPELFIDPARRLMPFPVRLVLGLMRVSEFLRMRIVPDRQAARAPMHLPRWVPLASALSKPLLLAGVPMGPNVLVTIRGRKTGRPRTTPLTVIEHEGRRGLISPFGEAQWVHNLRAAGRATIHVGRRLEDVSAVELGPAEAADFIRHVLAPHARRLPVGAWIVRHLDRIDIDHPEEAAKGRPVFELRPSYASGSTSASASTSASTSTAVPPASTTTSSGNTTSNPGA
jgi:deazaflavin-dependent oxidoreductase (nitroreductase family)